MSHFYGTLNGSRGEATRCGTKGSGYQAVAASYQGGVEVRLHHDERTGKDIATIYFTSWCGNGRDQILYRGPVNPSDSDIIGSTGEVVARLTAQALDAAD